MKHRGWLVLALVVSLVLTAVAGVAADGGGYAVAWVEGPTQNVTNPDYALGAPDEQYATLPYMGQIMLDMGAEVSGGLVIYSTSSAPDMWRSVQLCTALNSCPYYGSFRPDPAGTLLEPDISFRYVFIWDGNSTSPGFGLDAVYGGPVQPAPDNDGDGISDDVDNCPLNPNADQADGDGDGMGDVCDACPVDPNNDADFDGVCGDVDNCPLVPQPEQTDSDSDGTGDICDICHLDPYNDVDGDGVCGDVDNCPLIANPGQTDADGDGTGDACELPGLHVQTLTVLDPRAKRTTTYTGMVTVVGDSDGVISKAVVTAKWYSNNSGTITVLATQTAATNRTGVAKFTLRGIPNGTVVSLCVDSVTKTGYEYVSGDSDCDIFLR
ncbi:MAG: thrombospondin type 3 repeat-containing protein [Anaerolineae bacterium]